MRGKVIKLEDADGAGQISGDDGRTYRFYRAQVRGDAAPVIGQRADFAELGGEARDIYLITAPDITAPPFRTDAPPEPQKAPQPEAPWPGDPRHSNTAPLNARPAGNPVRYFTQTLTHNYANFHGRARRAEYWYYSLCWWGITIALVILSGAFSTLSFGGPLSGIFLFLWLAGTLVPNIAIVVRRLHDINASGWLYLLKLGNFFLLFLPELVIFILMLIDSSRADNVHGSSPKYSLEEKQVHAFD